MKRITYTETEAKSIQNWGSQDSRFYNAEMQRWRKRWAAVRHLAPFERWMVSSNIEHLDENGGIDAVVTLLKSQGYNRVASSVQQVAEIMS